MFLNYFCAGVAAGLMVHSIITQNFILFGLCIAIGLYNIALAGRKINDRR